jgi:hypothetical protein
LHIIDFTNRIEPMRMEVNSMAMAKVSGAAAPIPSPVSVGGKVYLQANVEIASIPMLPPNQGGRL